MVRAVTAREIADRSERFDLFDPPDEIDGSGRGGAYRPLIIAMPAEILVWGHHLVARTRNDAMCGAPADVAPADVAPDALPALLVEGSANPASLLPVALAAENRPGRYQWRELDRICALADELGITGIAPLLDPARDVTLLVPRYRALPPAHREALEQELIDMRTAERLASLPSPLLEDLLRLGASLSFSRRRQFLIAGEEVLRRGTAEDVLLRELRESPPEGRFGIVMGRRYPRVRRMEAAVDRVRQKVLRGTGVRLDPPASFEGNRYTISFDTGSVDELRRRLAAAQRLEKELDELLGILFEDPLDDTVAR